MAELRTTPGMERLSSEKKARLQEKVHHGTELQRLMDLYLKAAITASRINIIGEWSRCEYENIESQRRCKAEYDALTRLEAQLTKPISDGKVAEADLKRHGER